MRDCGNKSCKDKTNLRRWLQKVPSAGVPSQMRGFIDKSCYAR